jgi:hypothetical protein
MGLLTRNTKLLMGAAWMGKGSGRGGLTNAWAGSSKDSN